MSLEQLLNDGRFPKPIRVDEWTVYTNGKALYAIHSDVVTEDQQVENIRRLLISPEGMMIAKLADLKAFLGEPEWELREKCKKNPEPNVCGECCYECDYYPDCEGGYIVTYPKCRPVAIGNNVFDGNLVAQFLHLCEGDEIRWKDEGDILCIEGRDWKMRVMSYRNEPDGLKHFP